MAKKKKKGSKKNSAEPQMIAAKGGKSQSDLLNEVLTEMDEDNWLTRQQGTDFVKSLKVVVERELKAGRPVILFGIVKLVPRYHTAGEREVSTVFGDSTAPKVTKKYKPKVSLGISKLQLVTKALPNAAKMAKVVGQK